MEREIFVPQDKFVKIEEGSSDGRQGFSIDGTVLGLEIRIFNEFSGNAFYLTDDVNWIMGRDSIGTLCLVPLKK